jgi:hypothetical protein
MPSTPKPDPSSLPIKCIKIVLLFLVVLFVLIGLSFFTLDCQSSMPVQRDYAFQSFTKATLAKDRAKVRFV